MTPLARFRVRWHRRRHPDAPASCAEVALELQSHLDGRLAAHDAARIDAHLDVCRRCGLEAATYLAIKSSIRRQVPPPPDALDRLRSFVDEVAGGGRSGSGRDRPAP